MILFDLSISIIDNLRGVPMNWSLQPTLVENLHQQLTKQIQAEIFAFDVSMTSIYYNKQNIDNLLQFINKSKINSQDK